MRDERTNGAKPARRQPSGALLEQLRRAIAAHGASPTDDSDISLALRAIGVAARAEGVKAEQLVASLKGVFESLAPPPTLASHEARTKRLSNLVTICVREYYAPWADVPPSEPPRAAN